MKILLLFIKTILFILITAFSTFIITFFISIFLPENVEIALQILKNFLKIP